MSDSDDTDVLLLEQPGVFNDPVERDLELNSLHSQVVETLIVQVSELENRVTLIESVNSSCGNNSLLEAEYSMVLNDSDTGQDLTVNEGLSNTDELVSPCYALLTCEINSNTESSLDLNAPDSETFKSKEALLKEIDVYLSSINKPNHDGEANLKESNFSKESGDTMAEELSMRSPSFKRLDLPEVDRLLKEMESTQLEIENKLRMREAEYGIGGPKLFSNVSSRKSFPPVGGSNSPPERNSAPYQLYSSPAKVHDFEHSKPPDEIKRDSFLVGSSHNSDSDDTRRNGHINGRREIRSNSSFDSRRRFGSPRRKLFQSENLPLRKPASGQSSVAPSSSGIDLLRKDYLLPFAAGDSSQNFLTKFRDTDLPKERHLIKPSRNDILSLAELWRSEKDLSEDDTKKLRQKLEEEKIRRIHLESTIQELQKRVLEEQERLAVAVKVDEGKDKAIAQITDAWRQMVNHWKEIEADRYAMSQAIIKEKAAIKQKEEDVNKKVERWEKEVSQALDLAAGYKSKYEMLENEFSSTIDANNEKSIAFENKLKSLEDELKQLYDERKILTDKLNLTQEEHEKEKQLVEVAQKEVTSLQDLLKNTDSELTIVKEQRDLLSTRLKEEKAKSTNLEAQRASLQESLNEARFKLLETEESLKNAVASYEKNKGDLRAVYQSQLEAVVKEKLEEFQNQLDKAQSGMKAELTEARRLAQERAALQQQALVNSHAADMKKMDAMYKEEIRSLENKLAESERRREKLECGKKEIAQKLHGVMEAQWQQALSIITSEVSLRQVDNEAVKDRLVEQIGNRIVNNESFTLESSYEEPSYFKEAPTSSNQRQPNKQESLLKYIQMLLEKQPGKPIDTSSSCLWPEMTPSETLDESYNDERWNKIITNFPTLPPNPAQDPRQFQFSSHQKKPPWK